MLVDFNDLGTNLDDFEGLALSPILPDGRQLLIVVSDNEFEPETPATQFFAFALDIAPTSETKGACHLCRAFVLTKAIAP